MPLDPSQRRRRLLFNNLALKPWDGEPHRQFMTSQIVTSQKMMPIPEGTDICGLGYFLFEVPNLVVATLSVRMHVPTLD